MTRMTEVPNVVRILFLIYLHATKSSSEQQVFDGNTPLFDPAAFDKSVLIQRLLMKNSFKKIFRFYTGLGECSCISYLDQTLQLTVLSKVDIVDQETLTQSLQQTADHLKFKIHPPVYEVNKHKEHVITKVVITSPAKRVSPKKMKEYEALWLLRKK